ncbi:hypothetical protein BBJ28_00009673 [Nothophytophthora sp. Chile5]|nr:hypothetical protein BBJ28_00009673 [Nothophytophthora sp. Chile5]
MSPALRCVLLLALLSQSAAAAASSASAFVQLHWPNASLLHVSLAESAVVAGTKSFFGTASVTVLDVRSAPQATNATNTTAFDVLLLLGDPLLAFNSTTTVNTTGLATALGLRLEAAVLNATASSSAGAVAASTNDSAVLLQVVGAFRSGNATCQSLSSVQVLAQYNVAPNFPALRSTEAPKATPFLSFTVLFRDVKSPAELPQTVVYQTRRGVVQFLGGDFNLTHVVASGPAKTASDSALLVNQSFFLLLPGATDASLLGRETLANLLMFGDPTRPVAGDSANTTRPAMFLDFMFPATDLVMALQSESLAASASFASTLFPYVFQSINVDLLPAGNPALPAATAGNDTAALLAAISEDAFQALRRKQQRFQYDPASYFATLPTNVTYPANASSNDNSSNSVFSTTVYWANTLGRVFWLERAESVEPLAWNLFPATSFFLGDATSLPAAPLLLLGNASTPLWTLQAATPGHLDLALHFRSADDNATLVKVEVAVTLHSSGDAESTVTSIARAAGNASSYSVSPLDIVVRHRSRLLLKESSEEASKLLLFLELGVADVTEKSAGGCTHCQQLLEWCAGEPKCAKLQSCVFSAMQNPVSKLLATSATLAETQELSPFFTSCLGTDDAGSVTTSVDMDALMLFTSAIRCQLGRLCAVQPSSNSSVIPSGSKLVWSSGEAQHHLQPATGQASFPLPGDAPVNISVRVGARVLCYLPLWSNATAASLQTTIARSCTFAKYLGTLRVVVATNASVATAIEIFYKGLVGPMPTLTAVNNGTQNQPLNATITTISSPSIRLRLDSTGGPTPYAETTSPSQVSTCAECKRLALDVCLRDPMCAAYADCVLGFSTGNGAVTVKTDGSTTSSLADAVLELVRGDAAGTQLSLQAGVTACQPAANGSNASIVDVNGASWRKLVNASACFSRSLCPLSLAPVLSPASSSVAATVGQWSVSPAKKLQRLVYTGKASSLNLLQIPLALQYDGVKVTASSNASDPGALAIALRTLVRYDDISVSQLASTDAVTSFAWTIAYGHWIGELPHFLAVNSSAEWTLVATPTISTDSVGSVPNDCIFKLVPRAAANTTTAVGNGTTTSGNGTTASGNGTTTA